MVILSMQLRTTLACALLALVSAAPLTASDWPQWRGPKRDDVSTEKGLLQQWPAGGPTLVWKATGLGAGHGGVSIAGGRVFTTGDKGESALAVALGEAQGEVIWRTPIGKAGGGPAGPRTTPTVDGSRVYVLGQLGDLVCLQAANGQVVWRKNLKQDFGGQCGGWQYSESPLVDGNRIICTPGGSRGTLVALDKATGALLWQTKDWTDSAEYSSPILETIGGVPQYIQFTGEHVVGVEPATGKILWRAQRKGVTATVPTPVYYDNRVFVASGYGVGCNLFEITKAGGEFQARQVYANKNMVNHHGGVVRVGDYLYGYSDGKGWVCQELKTGNLVWKNEGVGKGSLTCADGYLYLRSESGKGVVALVDATPDGYRERSRFDQPNRSSESSWPHPMIANGKLYIRDQDVLLCFDVKAK
jgi:outer membrane protein assembly factor BamB